MYAYVMSARSCYYPSVKRHPVLTPGATSRIDPLVQVNFSNSLSAER